jgi:hypothetical protein
VLTKAENIIVAVTAKENWSDGSLNPQARLDIQIPERGEDLFPDWLRKLIDDDPPPRFGNIVEHPRHIGNIGFSEPYGCTAEEMMWLGQFCIRHGLRFSLIGHSHHYPGSTFRLAIWRPQDHEQLKEICHWDGSNGKPIEADVNPCASFSTR